MLTGEKPIYLHRTLRSKQGPVPGGAKMKLGVRVRSIALFEQLGLGLVTGAADDDPSGIAT